MIDNPSKMTCAEFQDQMAELIGSGADPDSLPHLKDCADCRALLAQLNAIADAARQLFPSEEPPEEVWERIESAIKRGS
jgi:hypothetical protein